MTEAILHFTYMYFVVQSSRANIQTNTVGPVLIV